MPDRRQFMKDVGRATAGAMVVGSSLAEAGARSLQSGAATKRRQIMIGGRRVKTIDIHTHVYVREVIPLLKDVEWGDTVKSAAAGTRGNRLTPDFLDAESVRWMDRTRDRRSRREASIPTGTRRIGPSLRSSSPCRTKRWPPTVRSFQVGLWEWRRWPCSIRTWRPGNWKKRT